MDKFILFFLSFHNGQSSGQHPYKACILDTEARLIHAMSTPSHAFSFLHTHPYRITLLSIHTCMVCYLTWQTPNCDQLVCVECGQSDYLKTQAPSPLVSIPLFQSVIRITITTIHTAPQADIHPICCSCRGEVRRCKCLCLCVHIRHVCVCICFCQRMDKMLITAIFVFVDYNLL